MSGQTGSLQLYWLFPFPKIIIVFLLNELVFLMACSKVFLLFFFLKSFVVNNNSKVVLKQSTYSFTEV